jgi:hypothetical protein
MSECDFSDASNTSDTECSSDICAEDLAALIGVVSLGHRSKIVHTKIFTPAAELSPVLKTRFLFDKKLNSFELESEKESGTEVFIERPAAEVKYKWRQLQIASQHQHASSINSSWRLKQVQHTCVWGGWLYKRSSGIVPRWQLRWFELWQDKAAFSAALGSCAQRALLKYTVPGRSGDASVKRAWLIAAHRDHQWDRAGCACVSAKVDGRSKQLLLDATSNCRAIELLSHITFVLAISPEK